MWTGGSKRKTQLLNEPVPRAGSSFIPDIVVTSLVVALAACGSCFIYQAEYMGGLHGAGVGQSVLLAPALKPLIVFITSGMVVPMVAIRLFDRRLSLGCKLMRLMFPVICLLALLIPIRVLEPAAAIYLRGFERRMLEKVDVGAVQEWLAADGQEHAGRVYRESFPADLPACLTGIRPGELRFSDATSERGLTIEFLWHAPHGENYGLVVGSPSTKSPNEGVILPSDRGAAEFRRFIKPGVYVFARG